MTEVVTTANQNNFQSRQEMLQWINDTLKLSEKKIENLGTGAIFCQLFDSVHPGKIQMNKVNWKAKYENEYMGNFKLLQTVLEKMGVNKPIDVPKLIKCKYQDNLELLQWMKKYHDQFRKSDKPYDAVARRGAGFVGGITDKSPSNAQSMLNVAQQAALNILDSSGISGISRQPSLPSQHSRHPQKKSLTQIDRGNAHNNSGSNNTSSNLLHVQPHGNIDGKIFSQPHSCQSSISNISMDQETILNNMLDDHPQGQLLQESQKQSAAAFAASLEKDSVVSRLKDERDFYYKKIESIDHMIDGIVSNTQMTPLEMKAYIKTILYTTRENILTIHEDGTVTLTDKEANLLGASAFEGLTGLEQLQEEILATDGLMRKHDKERITREGSPKKKKEVVIPGGGISIFNSSTPIIPSSLINSPMRGNSAQFNGFKSVNEVLTDNDSIRNASSKQTTIVSGTVVSTISEQGKQLEQSDRKEKQNELKGVAVDPLSSILRSQDEDLLGNLE